MVRGGVVSVSGGWERGRWWMVTDADGKLWCHTSVEGEAREMMRPGDVLWKEWVRTEYEWRVES